MEVPAYIEYGLILIAYAIKEKRGDTGLLTSNYGEPEFECPVFSMRTYCLYHSITSPLLCWKFGGHPSSCPGLSPSHQQ